MLTEKRELEILSHLTKGMTPEMAMNASFTYFGYTDEQDERDAIVYACDDNINIVVIFLLLYRNYIEKHGESNLEQRCAMVELAHAKYLKEHSESMVKGIKKELVEFEVTGPRVTITYRINEKDFDDIEALANKLYEKCTKKPEQWVVWMNALANNPDVMLQIWNQLVSLGYIGDCTYDAFFEPFQEVIWENGRRATVDLNSHVYKCENCGEEHIHLFTETPPKLISERCENKGYTTKQRYLRPLIKGAKK